MLRSNKVEMAFNLMNTLEDGRTESDSSMDCKGAVRICELLDLAGDGGVDSAGLWPFPFSFCGAMDPLFMGSHSSESSSLFAENSNVSSKAFGLVSTSNNGSGSKKEALGLISALPAMSSFTKCRAIEIQSNS